MNIKNVMERNEEQLMRLPNVKGVGIGEKEGKTVLKVLVAHKVPESSLQPHEIVPKILEGYQTDVEEVGELAAQL
jgi:hypothetical protein